jgi:hypothetical protein
MKTTMRTLALAMGCGLVTAACAVEDFDDVPSGDAGPGGGADAEPGDGLQARCDIDVTGSTVCLEAAAGRPGDTVEVEVHVLLDPTCDEFHEGFAIVEYDHEVFELASDEVDGDCYKLDAYEFSDGARVVDWYIASDVDGSTECPAPFASGFQGTIDFTILDGAPEDDYSLPLEAATVEGTEDRCDGFGTRGGLIRVLPPR